MPCIRPFMPFLCISLYFSVLDALQSGHTCHFSMSLYFSVFDALYQAMHAISLYFSVFFCIRCPVSGHTCHSRCLCISLYLMPCIRLYTPFLCISLYFSVFHALYQAMHAISLCLSHCWLFSLQSFTHMLSTLLDAYISVIESKILVSLIWTFPLQKNAERPKLLYKFNQHGME